MNTHKIIVAGTGPDIGKTLVSAILVKMLQADYWKPVQCGNLDETDTDTVRRLTAMNADRYYPERYRLLTPLSPHHAARLEGISIIPQTIIPPKTSRNLVIECAGGVLVPLTMDVLQLDLFAEWNADWILVSKHYLGSINHTLMSLEAMQKRNVKLIGIVFNGEENMDTEQVILKHSKVPVIGRLTQEINISPQTINQYAEKWKTRFCPAQPINNTL